VKDPDDWQVDFVLKWAKLSRKRNFSAPTFTRLSLVIMVFFVVDGILHCVQDLVTDSKKTCFKAPSTV